jgi:hypothetical protein
MYVWPKVGDTVVIKKAPKTLSFLKGREGKVITKTKDDYLIEGLGTLVVDFGSIRKKLFAFKIVVNKPEVKVTAPVAAE